jgi:hypothetical protein
MVIIYSFPVFLNLMFFISWQKSSVFVYSRSSQKFEVSSSFKGRRKLYQNGNNNILKLETWSNHQNAELQRDIFTNLQEQEWPFWSLLWTEYFNKLKSLRYQMNVSGAEPIRKTNSISAHNLKWCFKQADLPSWHSRIQPGFWSHRVTLSNS